MFVNLLGWQIIMFLLAGHVQEFQHMNTCQIKEIIKIIQSTVSISTKQLTALNYVIVDIENIVEILLPTKSSSNHTPQKEIFGTNEVWCTHMITIRGILWTYAITSQKYQITSFKSWWDTSTQKIQSLKHTGGQQFHSSWKFLTK